jgi:hypothetical protein
VKGIWSKYPGVSILLPLLLVSHEAMAQDVTVLTADEKLVIGQRLGRTRDAKRNLRIEIGDTVFILKTLTVPRRKLPGTSLDYEGIVGAINTSKGLFIDERIDRITFAAAAGNNIKVTLRYAVGVLPDAKKGGEMSFRLSLVKRKGLGEVVLSSEGKHKIRIRRPVANTMLVAADFRGYRVYQLLAAKHAAALKQRGVTGLSLKEGARLPPLVKLKPVLVNGIFQFDRWRRRMWIAHRHLLALSKIPDKTVADLADTYLNGLNLPPDKMARLPQIPLSADSPSISEARIENVRANKSKKSNKNKRAEAAVPLSEESSNIVQPLENRSSRREGQGRARPSPPERRSEQKSNVSPIAPSKLEPEESGTVRTIDLAKEEDYQRGKKSIPSHPRFLQLADPNVTFGGAIRANYQQVTTTETAQVPTLFAELQLPLLNDLGISLTLPLAHISVDLPRTEPTTTIGNPTIEAKYRFHLPKLMSRRPTVAIRTSWAIPASHGPKISPTTLPAEEFVLAAQFIETSAFLYERHAVGGGFSSSWELGPFHIGGQFQLEYLLPISEGLSTQSFPVVSYGAAVGYRPLGELLGVYLESQGATLLVGPRRNEVTTYAGVRSQAFDFIEFAAWAALTVAPDARPTNLGFGGELRFVYDVDSVILFGSSTRKFGDVDWEE